MVGVGVIILGPISACRACPVLKDWATELGLEIDWVDSAWIRVCVTRAQLEQFLEEVFGTAPESSAALQVHVSKHFPDDKTYVIVAEEF